MAQKLTLLFLVLAQIASAQLHDFRQNFTAMGCAFEVVIVAPHDSAQWANAMLDSAQNQIDAIEKIISSWDTNSQTSRVNNAPAQVPVAVNPLLYNLVERCILLAKVTNGDFDITYASMADVWNFSKQKRNQWPDSSTVCRAQKNMGFEKLNLSVKNAISRKDTGTKIGFGGVGKGFVADFTAKKLQLLGVQNGVINASGDLYCWGTDAQNLPWKVAVAHPKSASKILLHLEANNQAVVTSGNYEKYKMHQGVRYAHIINPKTGYPVTGVISATVVAPKAELADALATTIFVKGVEKGLEFINQIDGVECIIFDQNLTPWYSKNVKKQTY